MPENQAEFQATVSANSTVFKEAMTIEVTGSALNLLREIAERQGLDPEQALQKAIATECYLSREIKNGARVLIRKRNNQIRELSL